MTKLKVACIQLSSSADMDANWQDLETRIRDAAANGATLIATPENSCHIRGQSSDKLQSAKTGPDHPFLNNAASLAKELDVWILLGSVSILLGDEKLANRSYLFSPQGQVAATYDKIHLFDVDLPTGERHRESDLFTGGKRVSVTHMDGAALGLTICYDLRFSYLYRALAKAGAGIIAVPAAFTVPTGEAHWEVLLRSRAIETGSYIIAPAQTGQHEGGRKTWGHSLIVDPWGRVLADAGTEPGIIYAYLDMCEVEKARNAIPALRHDREYSLTPSG